MGICGNVIILHECGGGGGTVVGQCRRCDERGGRDKARSQMTALSARLSET